MKMGNVALAPEALPFVIGLIATALLVCAVVGWFHRKPETWD